MSGFSFLLSVLVMPFSAMLKRRLVPAIFMKVLICCNQVTIWFLQANCGGRKGGTRRQPALVTYLRWTRRRTRHEKRLRRTQAWNRAQYSTSQVAVSSGLAAGEPGKVSPALEGPPGRVRSIMLEKSPEDFPVGNIVQSAAAKVHGLHIWVIGVSLGTEDAATMVQTLRDRHV